MLCHLADDREQMEIALSSIPQLAMDLGLDVCKESEKQLSLT